MENLFRKYGWVLKLVLIALACLLIALGINSFIAGQLAPYTVPSLPDLAAAQDGKKARKRTNRAKKVDRAGELGRRCLFECAEEEEGAPGDECPGGCGEGEKCVAGQCVPDVPVDPEVAGSLPVPSELNFKLLGTMVSDRPEWSTALVEDPAAKRTIVVRTGDDLLGQAKLVEVKRDRIIIERVGRLEYIRLDNTIMGNPSAQPVIPTSAIRPPEVISGPSTSAPSTATPRSAEARKPNVPGGVDKVSDDQYVVDREMMNEQLSNKAELAKGANIIPNYKQGKKNGLKLINVQSGSAYNKLGLQSGDVLTSVNGTKIRSQAHAMELMEKFREADEVTIEFERRGRKEQINYKIK